MQPRRRAGFTLIELMMVVAILGILAATAIPYYYSFVYRARTAEPRVNLNLIRQAHTAYRATHDCYMDVNPNPGAVPSGTAILFDISLTNVDPCTAGVSINFNDMGLDLAGPVYYQYQCKRIDLGGDSGFACDAEGDLDGDGDESLWVLCSDEDEDGACDGATAKGNVGAVTWFPHRTSAERF